MKKIGIIGSGLMGGSIFQGIEGSILFGDDWKRRIEEVDFLILAVPIPAILEIAEEISHLPVKKPLIVLDIGSVKGPIAKKFEEKTKGSLEFVASHPMAGREKNGYEHSDPALFEGAVWVITPHEKNSEAALQKVEGVIHQLKSIPIRMEAEEHDRRAAMISQLPYLISKTLRDFVDPESLAMAGPGFKSMVRLANDNPEMRKEIYRYNRKNIDRCLKGYIDSLTNLFLNSSLRSE